MTRNRSGIRKGISRRSSFRAVGLLTTAGLAGTSARANRAAYRTGSVRTIDDLDTPAMIIDLDILEKNIKDMQEVCRKEDIFLQGVMTYPSRLEAKSFIEETVELFRKAGLPIEEISGGGTGREGVSKQIGCNVTRSGSYVFEGLRRINSTTNPPNPTTCATRMVATVVSTPVARLPSPARRSSAAPAGSSPSAPAPSSSPSTPAAAAPPSSHTPASISAAAVG